MQVKQDVGKNNKLDCQDNLTDYIKHLERQSLMKNKIIQSLVDNNNNKSMGSNNSSDPDYSNCHMLIKL